MARKSVVTATFLLFCALWAAPAAATITPAPAIVSAFPTQSTGTVGLSLAFPTVRGGAGTSGLLFSGVPAGVSVVPANPLSYSWIAGAGGASTTFHFAMTAAATPGTYTVTISDQFSGPSSAGSGSVTLVILSPSFSANPSPNPVTLTRGGSAQTVTVSTTVDPGFSFPITYSFSGFPAGVSTGGTQTTSSPYPARSFTFSATITAPSGTLSGTLTGQYVNGSSGTVTKTFPMAVVLITPDISASFASPTIALCNGGASIATSVALSPINGYTGTPTLAFTSIPAGITVAPANPPASPMPPGQTIPFTVSASGAAAGPQSVTLHISDPGAGISKNLALNLTITNPDHTPMVAPPSVTVTAGGSSQTFTASLSGNSCFAATSVAVTPSGQPAGMTFTPGSASLTGPGYVPVSLSVQAASSVAPGTYPVTFTFVPSSGQGPTRTASASVVVGAAPDFSLSTVPTSASVVAGGSGTVTISASGFNGFAGSIDVSAPSMPGVTFTPATFALAPGGSRAVSIVVSAAATPATLPLNFTGTAAGITGSRSAAFTLTILPAPDFTLAVAPASVSVSPGASFTATVSNAALNGFSGTVSATAPTIPNLTFTPAAFTLAAGGSRTVTVDIGSLAPTGPLTATFLGTAGGVAGTRSAMLSINVTAAPDFSIAVAPASQGVAAGSSASLQVTATGFNGFAGTINVSTPSVPHITFTPPTFALSAGGSQAVAVGVSASAPAGPITVTLSGTAAGVTGTRTATTTVTILVAPDFSLGTAPNAVSISPGGSATTTVSATALNGFAGSINVTAPVMANLTFTPASFVLPAGGSQTVTIAVAGTAPPASVGVVFSGAAAGVTGGRTATLTVSVTVAPDFSLSAAPVSLSLGAGGSGSLAVSAAGFNGFAGSIDVTSPSLSGVVLTPATFSLTPGSSRVVSLTVSSAAAPATLALTFTGTAAGIAGLRSATATLTILAAPDFTLAVSPTSTSVAPGASVTVALSDVPLNGFSGSVTVTAPTMPNFTFTPSAFTLTAGGSRTVSINVAGAAPAGPVTALFLSTGTGVAGTRSVPLSINVTAAADFSLSANPPSLTLAPGDSGTITLSCAGFNGFAGAIDVSAPALPGFSFIPATFTISAGSSRALRVTAAATAVPGPLTATFGATAGGVAGQRNAAVAITVTPAPPVITSVVPPGVATGSRSSALRLGGLNFQPGAVTLSASADLIVESTRVYSATLADVILSTRADARPGPVRIDLRNPDGQITRDGAIILIYPSQALGAPVGVTAASIVFPRPGTMVATSEALYPRALLATTGTGTIVGSWLFDGVPFDRFVATVSGGLPVAILAHAPIPAAFAGGHQLQIVIESPQRLVSPELLVLITVDRVSELRLLGPMDGAEISGAPALFRWSVVPGASGYEIEVERPGSPHLIRRRLAEERWKAGSRDLAEIGAGCSRWRVRPVFPGETPGEPTPWQRIEIPSLTQAAESAASAAGPEGESSGGEAGAGEPELAAQQTGASPIAPAPDSRRDWAVLGLATGTVISGNAPDQRDDVRTQLSTQGDLTSGLLQTRFAGDVSVKTQVNEPNGTVQESKNWLFRAGAGSERFRAEGAAGYAPPSFLDQAQLLTSGLVHGGAEGRIVSPIGSLAYYETFDPTFGGTVAGDFGRRQKIRAGAFQAPGDPGRFVLRLIGLTVEDQPSPFSSGGKGDSYGLFAKVTVSPLLTALLEIARGSFRPTGAPQESEREGFGYWLGLSGYAGTFSYMLNLRKVDDGFINPANRGLTAAGMPNHSGGDLSLSQRLGRVSLGLQYRHIETGRSAAALVTPGQEDAGSLMVSGSLGPAVMLSASGNLQHDHVDEDSSRALPGSDRTQAGWTVSAAEMTGRMTFSESFTSVRLRDQVQPSTNQDMQTLNVTAGGALLPNFNLTGLLSATRIDGTATIGRTDQTMASIQPSLAIPRLFLSFQPRATYTRSKSLLTGSDTSLEQYQALLLFAPAWATSFISLQLSGDWTRSRSGNQAVVTAFLHRYAATLTVRWGAGSGPAAPGQPILPGVAPITAPQQSGTTSPPGGTVLPGRRF